MAEAIKNSDLPNYKFARFLLHPGLNIDVWHYQLGDYHDKLFIQYRTYGFPLSPVDSNLSCNTEVSNHYSALQFTAAIDQYLEKEIKLGAILALMKLLTVLTFIAHLS